MPTAIEKFIESFTPAQRARYLVVKEASDKLTLPFRTRKAELMESTTTPYTVAGPTLTPLGKVFQKMTLERDWDSLFFFLPPVWWGQYGMLGKYSFIDKDGTRTYIPFTEDDIRRFVFSSYYRVQPGHVCTDEQREMGVMALMKAGATHQRKFPPSDFRHIWPIYPGWGYPGQRFGCEKFVPGSWEKFRKVAAVAAIVAAVVFVGPAIMGKLSGTAVEGGTAAATGGASTGAATGGIVGAGTKAGALTAASKAGAITGIKITGTKAALASAVSSSSLLSKAQTVVGYVNKARTVDAIIKGELPPPPINLTGGNFTDWAMNIAKEEIISAAKQKALELGQEYIQKELTKQEEAKLRAEILAMQIEMEKLLPPGSPLFPSMELDADVRAKIIRMQNIEKQREQQLILAVAAGGALLMLM